MIIYISPFEHNAVYRTVIRLTEIYNIEVRILEYDHETFDLDISKIELQFIKEKPDFIAVTHVGNVFGKIVDINAIGKLANKYGCRYMVDCSQSAGLLETDIIKCQADYMVFAGHKTLYGPFGCSGFICVRNSAPRPLIYGGTGVDSANPQMPNVMPIAYEAGSMNILSISGLNAALKWINKIGRANIFQKESANYHQLVETLNQYSNLKIIGHDESCTSIVSCLFNDYAPENIGDVLSRNNVMVRTGLHCAPIAHRTYGTYPAGTVRFSISYFTSDNDFKSLSEALDIIEEG